MILEFKAGMNVCHAIVLIQLTFNFYNLDNIQFINTVKNIKTNFSTK